MCLLLLALRVVARRPWLLLANRDEFHARASAPANFWPDRADIFGGRDLAAGGSWLAVNRNGRYAAVTNVRTGRQVAAPRSRGSLVADFVRGADALEDYAADVAALRGEFGPFNLVVGDATRAIFVSSIDGMPRELEPGVHAFSNGSRHDEWPKMRRLRAGFAALTADAPPDPALLELLADARQPEDGELPDTGVGLPLERLLAPIFIRGETYGTRASTLAYACDDGSIVLSERRFGPQGELAGETRLNG